MKRDFTIIVLARNDFIRNIKLSGLTLFALLFTFSFITISAFGLFIYNTKISITELKLSMAEEQFRNNMEKIAQLKSQLNNLKNILNEHIVQDNKQRNLLQLATIHPDVWSMGIGGGIAKSRHHNLSLYNSKILEEIYRSLDILKGQVDLRWMSIGVLQQEIKNKLDLWKHTPSINPIPGAEISSSFGYRVDPFDKTIRMHEGIDLSAPKGTPIQLTADGIVVYADWNMGYGYVVDVDHGYGFKTRYAHLSQILVNVGDVVKRGQIIGRVGATGRAVSSHLHYEVLVGGINVNPVDYIDFKNIVTD